MNDLYYERRRLQTAFNIVQAMTDEISALCRRFPSTMRELFLAAELLHVRAGLQTLSPEDRKFFNLITTVADTKIVHSAPDPQEKAEEVTVE